MPGAGGRMTCERDSLDAKVRAALRALAAFVIFPNALFWLLGLFFFTNRAWINIDYALLGAAWLWLPRPMRIGAFALLFILDAIGSTAAMYNIHPFGGIVALLKAPIGLILVVIVGFLLALILATSVGYFAVHYLSDRRRRFLVSAVMLAVAALSVAADKLVGTPVQNVATSSVDRFRRDLRDRIKSARTETVKVAAATDRLRGEVQQENVVLIVVESLGVLSDPFLDSLVFGAFENEQLQSRYEIRRGDVAFSGGTTSGELRELCGIFADYITVPTSVFESCLPRQLKARGYATFAVHGFKDSYYNRARWYPLLFDSIYFDRDLDGEGECGTQFRGVCDRDAFRQVETLAKGGGKRFVYWLTMDAHTPVETDRRQEFGEEWSRLRLDDRPVCRSAPEVCLQALFWRDMTQRVASLAADAGLPPTRFLLVGDHAPAFVRRDRAEQFVPGRVPYVEMAPNAP